MVQQGWTTGNESIPSIHTLDVDGGVPPSEPLYWQRGDLKIRSSPPLAIRAGTDPENIQPALPMHGLKFGRSLLNQPYFDPCMTSFTKTLPDLFWSLAYFPSAQRLLLFFELKWPCVFTLFKICLHKEGLIRPVSTLYNLLLLYVSPVPPLHGSMGNWIGADLSGDVVAKSFILAPKLSLDHQYTGREF